MIHKSAKTAAILAAFMALNGTAALISGCGQEKQVQGEKLTDENGRTYYLIKNPDGTETARYENGEEVTFRRDENDNLHYISGMSNLLPLMMMSYFMFHGMGGWSGHYDRNSGTVINDRPAYTQQKNPQYGTTNSAKQASPSYKSGTSSNKSTVKAPAGGKTGFGGAGVRGGAS